MSKQQLTILFVPLDGVGHYNSCLGLGEQLLGRGHKVIFAVQDIWKTKLTPLGFLEEPLYPDHDYIKEDEDPQSLTEILTNYGELIKLTPEEQIEALHGQVVEGTVRRTKENDPQLRRIIEKVKPDVIIADVVYHQPAVMDSGIPWILSITVNPSAVISSTEAPPAFTGYSTTDQSGWESFRTLWNSNFAAINQEFQEWVYQNGGSELDLTHQFPMNYSPYANIYQYPEELDYTGIRPNPPKFYRFDTYMRKESAEFEIPEELRLKSGKLIYLSMGTIACTELNTMRRLIGILGISPNRFIVAKGSLGARFDLANNMWGRDWLPQTKVLPLVDLVITHGGSNTIVDSLYFGKPLIILPFILEQPDNAQRVKEAGVGLRLHPMNCTEQELLEAVEAVGTDKALGARLAKISQRMQASNSPSRAADLIEQVARREAIATPSN